MPKTAGNATAVHCTFGDGNLELEAEDDSISLNVRFFTICTGSAIMTGAGEILTDKILYASITNLNFSCLKKF